MTPEELLAILLDLARKGIQIDALRSRCADLEEQVASLSSSLASQTRDSS